MTHTDYQQNISIKERILSIILFLVSFFFGIFGEFIEVTVCINLLRSYDLATNLKYEKLILFPVILSFLLVAGLVLFVILKYKRYKTFGKCKWTLIIASTPLFAIFLAAQLNGLLHYFRNTRSLSEYIFFTASWIILFSLNLLLLILSVVLLISLFTKKNIISSQNSSNQSESEVKHTAVHYKKLFLLSVIIVLIISTIIVLGLLRFRGFRVPSDNDNQSDTSSSESAEESIEITEPVISAENKEVFDLLDSFAWNESEHYSEQLRFPDLVAKFEEIGNENSFAAEFVERSKSVDYDSLDEISKMGFDAYLKLLLRRGEDYYSITDDALGEITNAWYGDYIEGNCKILFFQVTDTSEYTYSDGTVFYIDVRYRNDEHTLRTGCNMFEKNLQEDNKTIYIKGEKACVLDNITAELNNIIVQNQEFISFLIKYRDEIYAPSMNQYLSVVKEDADKKRAEEALLWEEEQRMHEQIPQIGMTGDEVKKSKWGYPDHVNRDTYKWGTEEQWVYENYGYVYFENGIVTCVSER